MIKRKLSFKWFGSLSNLSFRRKSDAGKDGAPKDEATDQLPAGEKTLDDLDARPRLPSYVRSSDMYTHMGTMPRHQKKKEKKAKEQEQKSFKSKGKTRSSQLGRSQSMKPSMDYVCESPLMTALSGKSFSTLERTTTERKPTASEKSILAPAAGSAHEDPKDQPIQDPYQVQAPEAVTADQCLVDPSPGSSKPSKYPDTSQEVTQSKESEVRPTLPSKRASKKGSDNPQKVTNLNILPERMEILTKLEEEEEKKVLDFGEVKLTENGKGYTDNQGEYVECTRLEDEEQRRLEKESEDEKKAGGRGGRMTERCSLWSALSAAACCFYRGSFMQVQGWRLRETGESNAALEVMLFISKLEDILFPSCCPEAQNPAVFGPVQIHDQPLSRDLSSVLEN
ncbi:uncharacterized protein sh2d3ca [Hoplias malabaricus]|uniref:uncharacterized protein sh2d3ca n=1 Tax=Hoplias malabaricus TaxID=27720 RepID=UPI003462AB8A